MLDQSPTSASQQKTTRRELPPPPNPTPNQTSTFTLKYPRQSETKMSYNPRMSILPAAQQSRSRKKEEEAAYANMRLPDREIVGCINELGVPFTVADLQKPNPIQVQMIFEWFGELLMNKTRTTVDPAMRAAAEDICGDFSDSLMPPDTRNLMGFFRSLRRLMEDCGVNDFSFTDLYKPTHDRLVKIFSYVINFVRFRESQTSVIDEHCNRGETAKQRIEQLYADNQNMEAQLEEMRFNRKQMEAQVAEKTRRNEDLKKKLLELRRNQEKVAARLEETKTKKMELTQELEEKTATKLALKQESAKLRPYTLQSPAVLQSSLTELSNTLGNDKSHIDSLDRRARALQTSSDSFSVVSADVASCIKLLEEISVELAKEEEENAKNARQRDALTERGANVREVERTEALLKRQLEKWTERTENLRKQSKEKAERAKESMEELRAVHKKLTEERSEKGKDIERRRVRIEQIEKKMLDLKENIENEVHAAHDEYLKMESHIKLYITEMEQAL
ncbi:putative kinetochore protein nuf2 [Podospora australis]|uniref:Probable kinetochore protein NUF2 n=1 Tax=Podospora australis TaxID=1536484 RepID=A0AAN6WYD4_9PEZI|nr:putative kinetochore protein nuf2 [Podospora australis]